MTEIGNCAKNNFKCLRIQIIAFMALSVISHSGGVFASYDNKIQEASELWVNINQQDVLLQSKQISKGEWSKKNLSFISEFKQLKKILSSKNQGFDGTPERFSRELQKAVAVELGVKNNANALLLAIKIAPVGVSLDEYRRDIWRGAEIMSMVNKETANNKTQKKQTKIRKELVALTQVKYAGDASQTYYRNYNVLTERHSRKYNAISKAPVTPSGGAKSKIASKVPENKNNTSIGDLWGFNLSDFTYLDNLPKLPDWLFILIVAIGAFILWIKASWHKVRDDRQKTINDFYKMAEEGNKKQLSQYGNDYETRRQNINKIFDSSDGAIDHHVLVLDYDDDALKVVQDEYIFNDVLMDLYVNHSLMTMQPRVRESLRALELSFNEFGADDDKGFYKYRFGLIYNNGQTNINRVTNCKYPLKKGHREWTATEGLQWYANNWGLSTEQCVNHVAMHLDLKILSHPDSDFVRDVAPKFKGGGEMLETRDIPTTSLFSTDQNEGLFLGKMSDSEEFLIVKPQGHLITIAGSGTGKTQCQVLPNLLTYLGSAIVLDVKGDLYDQSHKFRSTIGQVIHYDPLDPTGACFNPLYFINNNTDLIKLEADRLASSMIVTTGKDPFWDTSAKNVLQAIIVYHCLTTKPEDRHMGSVLNHFNTVDIQDLVAVTLKDEQYPDDIKRLGRSIDDIQETMLKSVITSANAQLNCWGGLAEQTTHGKPAWLPTDLQNSNKPLTVYISLKSGNPKDYKSILRVLIDTHFRELTKEQPAQADVNPVLFFLDEFGALDRLDTINDIVNRGRSYGLWLWPFLQSEQQIEEIYGNSSDFLGNFTVRSYLNPNYQTAEKLSREFGQQTSALDGSQNPLARAEDLSGNKYAQNIIVMGRGEKPAIINKFWTHQSQELQNKITTGNS